MARFLSLALISQITIILTQLLVLPVQIWTWGHAGMALWASSLALSYLIPNADFGLRTALFAAIAAKDDPVRIRTIWSVVRLTTAVVAVLVFGASFFAVAPLEGVNVPLIVAILAVNGYFEGLAQVRTSVAEAIGRIAAAEALFAGFAVVRLVLLLVAIGIFKVNLEITAVIYLVTAIAWIIGQDLLVGVGRVTSLLDGFRFHQMRRLARDAGWSSALTLTQWTQMQLPVIALQNFAPAHYVSAFVSTRVIFGLIRTVLMQFARVVSVRFSVLSQEASAETARTYLLLMTTVSIWFAASGAVGIMAENFWLTGPWFHLVRDSATQAFALSFALSSVFAIHQTVVLALARRGELQVAGAASYVFIVLNVAVCAAGLALRSVELVAWGLAAADLALLAMVAGPLLARSGASPEFRRARAAFVTFLIGFVAAMGAAWAALMPFNLLGAPYPDIWRAGVAVACALAFALVSGALVLWRMGGDLRRAFSPAGNPA